MNAPAEQLPELCPRVVAADGTRLITCGHTAPCPYHGNPIIRLVQPPAAT